MLESEHVHEKEGVIKTDVQDTLRARTFTTPSLMCGEFALQIHLCSVSCTKSIHAQWAAQKSTFRNRRELP